MQRTSITASAVLVVGVVASGLISGRTAMAASPAASTDSSPASAPVASGTIVFSRSDNDGAPATLYSIAPDGSRLHTIDTSFSCCNQWSFDGTRILLPATAPDGTLTTTAMLDPKGSNRMLVPLPDASLNLGPGAWTPDSHIVFEGWDDHDTSRNGLYVADPADISTLRRLTNTTGGAHDFPLSVSPDGSHVLLMHVQPDPANPGNTMQHGDLYVVGLDGTGLTRLSSAGMQVNGDTSWGNQATWSPDSARVAFVASAVGAGSGGLYVTGLNGGQPMLTATDIATWETAQWSPAGDWIAFSGTATDSNGVVVIHPDGTGKTALVPTHVADGAPVDPGKTCCPVWSPDGHKLLFQVSQGTSSVDLFTMNADGTDLTRLTDDPGFYAWYSWGS